MFHHNVYIFKICCWLYVADGYFVPKVVGDDPEAANWESMFTNGFDSLGSDYGRGGLDDVDVRRPAAGVQEPYEFVCLICWQGQGGTGAQ